MANFRFYRNTSSLARRVLLICMALIVIPLIVFALLLSSKEHRLQERDRQVQLSLLGHGTVQLTEQWIKLNESNLNFITHLLKEKPEGQWIEQYAGDSTLFTLEQGTYRLSNDPSLEGQSATLVEQEIQIAPLALGRAPSIVLLKDGVGIAVDAQTWVRSLAKLEGREASFYLVLVDREGKEVTASSPASPALATGLFEVPSAPFKFKVALTADGSQGVKVVDSLIHFIFLLLFLGGGCALWLTARMARPLRQLHNVMDRVQQGDLTARYVEDRLGFEINQIGGHFNQTLEDLIQQRLAKQVLERELAIGRTIQKSLFPKEIPHAPGISVAAGFSPAKQVAGDFYDLFLKDSDKLLIVIADASDKGISACLYSLILRSLIRSQVDAQTDLAEAIYEANQLFCRDTGDSGNFATAWIGLYDLRSKQLTYCNAGHPPAFLLRGGKIEEINHGIGALGVSELIQRPQLQSLQLERGDQLLLLTDGVLEAQDSKGKLFGKKATIDCLQRAQNKTPRESVDLLLEEIARFSQGAEQSDDLTVLSVKID